MGSNPAEGLDIFLLRLLCVCVCDQLISRSEESSSVGLSVRDLENQQNETAWTRFGLFCHKKEHFASLHQNFFTYLKILSKYTAIHEAKIAPSLVAYVIGTIFMQRKIHAVDLLIISCRI